MFTEKFVSLVICIKETAVDTKRVQRAEIKKASKMTGVRPSWKFIDPYAVDKNVFDFTDVIRAAEGEVIDIKISSPNAGVGIKTARIKAPKASKVQSPKFDFDTDVKVANMLNDMQEIADDSKAGYFIPVENPAFVSFGKMSVTNKIIRSGKFCPIFIFGETGLGKSFSVNQLAARANREVIRINVNAQTCEEDFIGGFRLINGETVWQDGPLVIAMKRGAILLIDEVTALNPAYAFMLFTALEGEPVYIKKINKIVTPVDGFTVIATDNTKGYGTSSGKYVGVNVQNEAFLDRFTIAVEYDYPTPAQEFRMLSSFGNDEKIMKELIKWANFVRATYKEGAIDVTISPRRLINIMRINEIFGDLRTSIAHSIARFDADVVESLLDFLDKIVSDPNYSSNDEFNEVIENNDIEV